MDNEREREREREREMDREREGGREGGRERCPSPRARNHSRPLPPSAPPPPSDTDAAVDEAGTAACSVLPPEGEGEGEAAEEEAGAFWVRCCLVAIRLNSCILKSQCASTFTGTKSR